jgi:hypothetical protein
LQDIGIYLASIFIHYVFSKILIHNFNKVIHKFLLNLAVC